MGYSVTFENGIGTVQLEGKIDTTSAPDLEAWFAGEARGDVVDYVFDFGAVPYITSAGLRVFLKIAKELGAKKGRIALSAMNVPVSDVFKLSGFDSFMQICGTVAEAQTLFRPQG